MVDYHVKLDATFAALSDPTRRAILARLAAGECTISDIAAPFAMSLPAVSKHLRVLQRAGLATIERDGRVRRCRLRSEPLRDAGVWIERYRTFWEGQLNKLARYLGEPLVHEEHSTWPRLPHRNRKPPTRSPSGGASPRRPTASSARGRRPRK